MALTYDEESIYISTIRIKGSLTLKAPRVFLGINCLKSKGLGYKECTPSQLTCKIPEHCKMGKTLFFISLLVLILQGIVVYAGEERESSRVKRSLPAVRDIYTLDHFVELVEKIERHPLMEAKTIKEISNYIRKLGYDSTMWTYLVGKTDALPNGVLTTEEKRVLTNMIAHRYIGSRELGVVKTPTGNVAMGHVITGICAGINRHKSLLVPKIAGLSIDNLYAATISGDLGQTTLFKQINQSRPLFGPGGSWSPNDRCPASYITQASSKSEATNAELLGDIDGFLLGYNLPKYVSRKVRLGQLLRMYYSLGIVYDMSFASCKRNTKFKELVSTDILTKQVEDFTKGYKLVWYGNDDFSSVPIADIPKLTAKTTEDFLQYLDTTLSSSTTCPLPNNEGCELPANVIFVMDDSGSIGHWDYEIEKKFVMNVTDAFEISPIQTRVAAIEYSSFARESIELDDYGSKTRLKCAVESMLHAGGGTNTADAVRLAYKIMKREEMKSDDVQQIMILLTDGMSNNRNALGLAVKSAKANLKDVTMIAVGVGNYQRPELELIATNPKIHVLTSTDFGHLIGLVKTLRKKTCEIPARLTISFRSDDGENKTAVIGFVSPGKSRFYSLPAELFYGIGNLNIEVTPYFGTVIVYASRIQKNPGPGNYTFKILPKGSSRKRRSTDSKEGAGDPLNLRVKEICQGYNETTCPPLYVAIQGSDSKLTCHESHCTLPNQIKFRIAKGYRSKAEWIQGKHSLVVYLVFTYKLATQILF